MTKGIYGLLVLLLKCFIVSAQTITHSDGSPLTTKYCYDDIVYELSGQPSGGTFTGCGMYQQNGQWYFNPVTATAGITVFPYQCNINYSVNNQTISRPVLIYKPVRIDPPLADIATCNGDLILDAKMLYAGAYLYQWAPGQYLLDADTSYTAGHIETTQTFIITAEDVTSGCKGRDTITVTRHPVPEITASADTVINARQQVQLYASGADLYLWSPSHWLDNDTIASPMASPQAPVTYQVIGFNAYGCSDTAEVFIDIRETLFVPNAFSPNGDGLNDVFRIGNFGYQGIQEFRVFNRWGELVFHTLDGTAGWDGTQNGQPAEVGNYYYQIRLQRREGPVTVFKGEVLLLR